MFGLAFGSICPCVGPPAEAMPLAPPLAVPDENALAPGGAGELDVEEPLLEPEPLLAVELLAALPELAPDALPPDALPPDALPLLPTVPPFASPPAMLLFSLLLVKF